MSSSRTYRVLVVTNMYPHHRDPTRGAFVKAQVDALEALRSVVEVVHIRGDRSAFNYWRAIGEVKARSRVFGPDVVYAFYGLSGWVALWQPAPVVLSLAGDDVLGTPNGRGGVTLKSRLGVLLSNWAAYRAAVVCVQSEQMQQRLWASELRQRAHVVPYGVDQNRFRPGDQMEARQRLGLSTESRIVLFPSTPTEPRKRIDLARAAIGIVQKEFPSASLQVVAGVRHSDMPDYYRAADCCLLTSDWEGSPNVVKEALLSGVPVVSTDVGDVRKWLALSPESVLCARDAESVGAGIQRVLTEHRRVNPTPFIAEFSSIAIARRMLDLFADALTTDGADR